MKNTFLIFLITLFACNSVDFSKEDYWGSEKLYGRVNELIHYESDIDSPQNIDLKDCFMKSKKVYTDLGTISQKENYNSLGVLESVFVQEFLDESTIKSEFEEVSVFETYTISKLNSLNKPLKSTMVSYSDGDTTRMEGIFTYDNKGNMLTSVGYSVQDTTFGTYKYEYREDNKIIQKIQTMKSKGSFQEFKTINEYDKRGKVIETSDEVVVKYYDEDGNLNSFLSKAVQPKVKTIKYEYNRKNNLVHSAIYSENEILEEALYDSKNNPEVKKYYSDANLNNEFKNKYKFDSYGNWIEKKVYVKRSNSDDKEFKFLRVEYREIKYFD